MAKTNKAEIIRLCKEINTKQGAGTIYTVGGKQEIQKIARWTSGIEDLDNIIGGGFPEGRVIEIFGSESAGKTSLLYHLMSMHDLALDIPIEGTFDGERARLFGNMPKQLLIYRAHYGEDALNTVIRFAKQGIPLIGIDSVPSLIPKEDIEKIEKASNKNSIEEFRIGGTARLLTKYLPLIEDIIEQTGTTVILVNQIRDKIGGMMNFGENIQTPGGHKLKHSASIRIQIGKKQSIMIPNKNPANPNKEEEIGIIMKLKVVKSKVCPPRGACEIPYFFDRGFVSHEEITDIRKEILEARKKKYGGK